MFELILNLIYPITCGFCHKLNKEGLCKKCEIKYRKYEVCNEEDKVVSVLEYDEIIRKKIIEYKFGNKAYLHKMFARYITKNDELVCELKKYDLIIPIPLHRKRKAR